MSKSPLHIAALAWAAAGYYVFPCHAGRKEPACPNGHNDATQDPEILNRWWAENPNFNVGCAPHKSGNTVIDVDGERGAETLRELEVSESALPSTLTISTPREPGRHLWFDGVVQTSVGTDRRGLGPKLDTRSAGGYVLMPPSIIAPYTYDNNPTGGVYLVQSNEDIADLPAWVGRRLATVRDHHVAGTDDLDSPENIGRVRTTLNLYVAAGDVAVQGGGGDDRTFRLACEVLDLGVSAETGYGLVRDIWNPACEPPWDDDDLRLKFENAAEYRQNDVGAYAVRPAAEVFADVARTVGHDAGHGDRKSRFYPLDLTEQAAQVEPSWIIPGLIPADGLVVCYGKPKSFKSFLALDLCLGIAAGESTFGHKPQAGAVVYAAGEGASNIARKHVPAWRIARQRPDMFPFYVVPCVPRVIVEGDTRELIKAIEARGIKPAVVVIDTMARAAGGLEENSAKDVGAFIAACDLIRETFGCTVLIVHHSGKDTGRGSRGSNALEGAVDTVLEVQRHEKTHTVALHVREQRSAQEREEPYTLQGHIVGPSLVFDLCSMEDYKAVIEAGQTVGPKKIGAALQTLGAYGYEKGVTTDVLAAELAKTGDADPKPLAKELNRARRKNEAVGMLCGGDPLRWHLLEPRSDKPS